METVAGPRGVDDTVSTATEDLDPAAPSTSAGMRKDGSRFWSSGTMTPPRDHELDPVGFLKILRDRTAERQAESAINGSP